MGPACTGRRRRGTTLRGQTDRDSGRGEAGRVKREAKWSCRPDSVHRALGGSARRGSHSSGPVIAGRLEPPTRRLARAALCRRCRRRVCLFGVAPDGGCRVSRPHRSPGACSSLWPCSSRHRARSLAVIPPFGVRTFLDAPDAPRLPAPLRKGDYPPNSTRAAEVRRPAQAAFARRAIRRHAAGRCRRRRRGAAPAPSMACARG